MLFACIVGQLNKRSLWSRMHVAQYETHVTNNMSTKSYHSKILFMNAKLQTKWHQLNSRVSLSKFFKVKLLGWELVGSNLSNNHRSLGCLIAKQDAKHANRRNLQWETEKQSILTRVPIDRLNYSLVICWLPVPRRVHQCRCIYYC